MDRDEEEGLRAFAITVGAYAGASYPERPLWVERDGRRIEVADVLARWREEERIGFRVRLAEGESMLMYYVPELDLWSGVMARDGAPPAVRRRNWAHDDA